MTDPRLLPAWAYILAHPEGVRKRDLIRVTPIKTTSAERILLMLEFHGMLTSEDEDGRIFAFEEEG